MANPFDVAGEQHTKPNRYAPIATNRFFTGLWTQRSPLRDAATPYLYEKFYSGSRYDSLIGGINVEVTNRLTLARRPGTSVYNSNTFSAILAFDVFKQFNSGTETIKVIADTATTVYDATGPSTKTTVFTKSGGAGQSYFQSVGNMLYFGNGVDVKKWNGNTPSSTTVTNWGIAAPNTAPTVANTAITPPYPSWAANTFYWPSLLIVDNSTPANIQQITTAGTTNATQPTWTTTPGGTTADGTAVWTCKGHSAWAGTTAYSLGAFVSVSYSVNITISEWDPDLRDYVDVVISQNYHDFFKATTAGTSGGSAPTWQSGQGTQVSDGTVTWTNIGPSAVWTDIGGTQLVSSSNKIVDSNNNVQAAQTNAFSAAAAPSWSTTLGGLTIDGTQDWFNTGPLTISAAGTAPFTYAYAFKNSSTGHVSTASPLSTPITVAANSYVTVTGARSTDVQVDKIDIYRTTQGGSTLLYLDEINNPASGNWSYQDTSPDTSLNALIVAAINGANNPPPSGLVNLTYHLGRIWGSVGNTVYYSGGPITTTGSGNESFPPLNTFVFPSQVKRLWPMIMGLMVFTVSDVYLIVGQGTVSSPLFSVPYASGIGLMSYNAFDTTGSVAYMITTDGQVISFDPGSGISEVGFPIGDQFSAFGYSLSNSYLTWHFAGSTDKAMYVAKAGSGPLAPLAAVWFRFSQTSAPETGINWSPHASIVAGFSAVKSIETSPGVRSLLMGPFNSGVILQRDLTVFQDNGSNYTANAVAGSMVLAQPGQLAFVESITTDCIALRSDGTTGTSPNINLWLDENSAGLGFAGPTLALTSSVPDPPQLATGTTILGRRYYLSQAGTEQVCRHIQIQFDWGIQNKYDELLGYTIFGRTETER